jgi:phosphomannomutase/phosphoglucomutase
MEINPYIFRGYDIRGIAGKDLDYEKVKKIAKAYAYFLAQRRIKDAVVGHDCRLTGEEYKKAVIAGLTESGINVYDIGMALTQMVYFAQYHFKSNGGVMITASHNPAEYNGMKLASGYSYTLGTEEILKIKEIITKNKELPKTQIGSVTKVKDLKAAYFADLKKRVSLSGFLDKARQKRGKIVIDASNGTTAAFMPELLTSLGYEVVELNCEIDGNFPNGTPDPTEEHILERLAKKVVEEKADLGVAYDGDGDRLGVVDEKGGIIWADVLVAIFADDILDFLPGGKIVYNVLCSKLVDEVVSKKGTPIMYKTGHSFIKQKVSVEGAVFGGELSGHFFFMDNFFGHDDGCFATLRLLEYLERKKKPFSEIIASFPKYISSPEIKLGCPDDKKVELVDKTLVEIFTKEFPKEKQTTIDGIRIDFSDAMFVIRYSQNGPYITIKFEAKQKKDYNQIKDKIRQVLQGFKEIDWREGVNTSALN